MVQRFSRSFVLFRDLDLRVQGRNSLECRHSPRLAPELATSKIRIDSGIAKL